MKVSSIKYITSLILCCMFFMLYLSFQINPKGSINFEKIKQNLSQTSFPTLRSTFHFNNNRLSGNPLQSNVIDLKFSPSSQRRVHPFVKVTKYRGNWEKVPYSTNKKVSYFDIWHESKTKDCNGNLVFYANEFLYTRSMLLDKNKAKCDNFGGEDIKSVFLQDEGKEYYEYEMGFFQSVCPHRPSYTFENKNHLNEWLFNLQTSSSDVHSATPTYQVRDFTIAVVRYEYANLYHTMTDWYNAFLLKEFFNKTAAETNILIIDTHPQGMLDVVWSHLFNYTRRLSKLPATSHFSNLVWGIQGYNSPLKTSWSSYELPLVEEFRSFFLRAFNVSDERKLNCKRLNVLLIWRRDYLAHPRNPKGEVTRKIANEAELLRHLRNVLPDDNFVIKASQIDLFDVEEQLQLVTWADVMVGMHGAGLTHAIFLKNSSAVIELKPNYYDGNHFSAICQWRNIFFVPWKNDDYLKELPNKSTIIPPEILFTLIKKAVKSICSQNHYKSIFGTSHFYPGVTM